MLIRIERARPCVVAALLVWSGLACAGMQEGKAAYQAGDYPAAVRELKPLAEAGDATAQRIMAMMCAEGQGTPPDAAQAAAWFRKAALQGDALSQAALGFMYRDGRGVAQDPVEAFAWYSMAADQGHAGAQFNVGAAYEHGDGVTKNRAMAESWYRKAAAQKFLPAQAALDRFARAPVAKIPAPAAPASSSRKAAATAVTSLPGNSAANTAIQLWRCMDADGRPHFTNVDPVPPGCVRAEAKPGR